MKRIKIALALMALLASPNIASALSLTPGTAFGIDNTSNQIIQYNQSGTAIIGTLAVPDRNYTALTIVGDQMYAAELPTTGPSNIYNVNPTTGALTFAFSWAGNHNLGTKDDHLIGVPYGGSGPIYEYTTTGVLVSQTPNFPARGAAGLDYYDGKYYAAQYGADSTGNIRVYDSTGAFLSVITLGLPDHSISASAYDPVANVFWVGTGYGDDFIRRYSYDGTLLSELVAGGPNSFVNGLAVVASGPAVDGVPLPAALPLFATGVAMLGLLARRRKKHACVP
jgi:hypothetical protein